MLNKYVILFKSIISKHYAAMDANFFTVLNVSKLLTTVNAN